MNNENPLGKKVDFPKKFSKDLLHLISRDEQRETQVNRTFKGFDVWNIYELLWLDTNEVMHHEHISITIDCDSEFIPESKSMKLFLGSIIYERFSTQTEVFNLISEILNLELNTNVKILNEIFTPEIVEDIPIKKTDQKLSVCIEKTGENKIFSFSPFRSLCPVTGQPDIAKIIIKGSLSVEDKNHIANYLGSFFNTNAYHEKCVEEIFKELLVNEFKFDSVEGHFERRGGISIIPVRHKI